MSQDNMGKTFWDSRVQGTYVRTTPRIVQGRGAAKRRAKAAAKKAAQAEGKVS
jgi:hypothetical protein